MQNKKSAIPAPLAIASRIVAIILAVCLFLFALDLMRNSFQHLSRDVVEFILDAASNPFIGLFIGLIITALIQSSSTSTTMIVAAVASGNINFVDAVPMIMGANIGTTITSTIVSLGFIGKREEFRRALSAGVVHDFFNILVVIVLFPLELNYHFLSGFSQNIASLIITEGSSAVDENVQFKFFNLSQFTTMYTALVTNSIINLIISFILLFSSIKIMSRIISRFLIGNSREKLKNYIFNNTIKSFFWGAMVTAGVQSSSITTSVIVPFVAKNKISLQKITPFIFGANAGTTITAFIAVFFKSHEAVTIAIVHLIFNVIGIIILLPFPLLRQFPIRMASKFAEFAAKYRIVVIIYMLSLFFIIPFFLIYFTKEN